MIYRIFNIKYDTDGEEVDGLPTELFAEADDSEPDDQLSDFISDNTGWCHFGFEYEPADKTYSFGTCPDALIKVKTNSQCPDGYPMTIRDKDEWTAIAAAVNQGIDSHLEAVTERSTFNAATGVCLVHPDELHVLLRRFAESGNEQAEQLRSAILSTLEIEEV